MDNKQTTSIQQKINYVSSYFEPVISILHLTGLKDNFDPHSLKEPSFYLDFLDELEEIKRQTRILFLHSVLAKVCLEEGKPYQLNPPYQANMIYTAVLKMEGMYYLIDEDGDLREIFYTEKFQQFIDDQYWELYEE